MGSNPASPTGIEEHARVLFPHFYKHDTNLEKVCSKLKGESVSEVVIMDTETTGIGPGHRILEIGGVIWDYESDKISGEFETLINPERDIDAKARLRHGLKPSDLTPAPVFSEVGPWLAHILHRRPVFFHNVNFDVPLLHSEFERAGISFLLTQVGCTYLATGLKLSEACKAIGYEHLNGGNALEDARATLQVLRTLDYRRMVNGMSRNEHSAGGIEIGSHRTLSRFQAGLPVHGYTLKRFSRSLEFSGLEAEMSYLVLLDEVLEDMQITDAEMRDLRSLANGMGLSAADVEDLNRTYLAQLESAALRDGQITVEEANLINSYARLLGLEATVEPTNAGNTFELEKNALICSSGTAIIDGQELGKSELGKLVAGAGYRFTDTLNKKDNIALLLLPDKTSGSSKAKKAAAWGIPTLSVEEFLKRLEAGV